MAEIKGGEKFKAVLHSMESKLEGLPTVKVGFMENSTYPDGTSVPMVAALNEFGVPSKGQPPRPFFRRMVRDKGPTWPAGVATQLKDTDYNVPLTLQRVGQGIKGQLQASIRDLTDPPLAPSTIARKGFSKPLIDTGVMLNSVDYEVDV